MLLEQEVTYQRHRPEQTLLYQLVQEYYPQFKDMMRTQGKALPHHVDKEFKEFLKCGRLEHGFLRVVCDDCKHEKLVAFSCKKRGFCPSCGARRMVESAKLLVDLEKAELIQRDMDNTYLDLPIDDKDSLLHLQAASVSYRIAVGPDTGKKVFTLQTIPATDPDNLGQLAKISGFSLHAGVFADSHQPDKLERLCRYIARPAVSEERLSLTSTGKVRYELKTPYNDGTTHVFFAPLDFMAKLAALVPPPRLNLTRFYGVFAPNAAVRAEVTASKRGKNSPKLDESLKDSDKPYHARGMNWAQRLKRVFNIDITQCERCTKHNVKIIACITEPLVIKKILDHLDKIASPITEPRPSLLPPLRAPPEVTFDDNQTIQKDFDWGA